MHEKRRLYIHSFNFVCVGKILLQKVDCGGGLNSGLDYVKSGLDTVKFEKLNELVTYYVEGNMLSRTLNKNQCKQEASKSYKEAYKTYRMFHFCHLCREFQTKIHFCNFSQKWQNFDERNLLMINGDSKAEVKRIAGFENKMKDNCVGVLDNMFPSK